MTPAEFTAAISDAGLTQAGFARAVSELSGQHLSPGTVNRWCRGHRAINPLAIAFVILAKHCQNTLRDITS